LWYYDKLLVCIRGIEMSALLNPPRVGSQIPTPSSQLPVSAADLARVSVEQYHQMVAHGVLTPDDRIELLDGVLVKKMSKNPDHVLSACSVRDVVAAILPSGWFIRTQDPISLDVSVPEPDVAIVRGKLMDYRKRHPFAADVAMVVEVAESSLSRDRNWKLGIYARNGIEVYWIVNLIGRTLEVYADPTGPCESPDYRSSEVLTMSDSVELVIAGIAVAAIRVAELIPDNV